MVAASRDSGIGRHAIASACALAIWASAVFISATSVLAAFAFRMFVLEAPSDGAILAGPRFANSSPRLSLNCDHLRTVLAVKGSLRRAQQRRALDRSGPF